MRDAGEVAFRIRIRKDRERSIRLRHPWIFSGSVEEVEALEGAEQGDVGDLVDTEGRFLARGTVQPDSQIVCRILTWEQEPIDRQFFESRIRRAADGRRSWVVPEETDACRVVNSEGDGLPGLVVDRYGALLAVQTLTSGMHRLRPLWLPALQSVLSPETIVERGERARRESLPSGEAVGELLLGTMPEEPVEIRENGLRFLVDPKAGQKTGFYLDQRENRASLRRHSRDQEVLNLFGYTGAFSVYAGAGGAEHVVEVESSETARRLSERNWALNGLPEERIERVGDDVFQYLRREERGFDRLVLDPPPFAKERAAVDRALRAYKDLHLWTFCRARPGALIWSFSCSQHVDGDLFQKVVFGAALDVGASVQWLGRLGAGPDHPVHLDHPQGEYLKGLWMRVLTPGRPPALKGREEERVPE